MKITIRQAREARGMSVMELAVATLSTVKSIYDWENGRSRPTESKLALLTEVLEVERDSLILKPAYSGRRNVADFIRKAEAAGAAG